MQAQNKMWHIASVQKVKGQFLLFFFFFMFNFKQKCSFFRIQNILIFPIRLHISWPGLQYLLQNMNSSSVSAGKCPSGLQIWKTNVDLQTPRELVITSLGSTKAEVWCTIHFKLVHNMANLKDLRFVTIQLI